MSQSGKWASRFLISAIFHGALATIITLYIVIGQALFIRPEPSRVIAAGSAGTWLTLGYIMYILIGVVAMATTALFYYYIEKVSNNPYSGIRNILAWIHLVLMNVGAVGTTWLMMISGYYAGAAMLPPEVGGLGWKPGQVHANIFYGIPLGYPAWITIFIVLLSIGVILGNLGFLISWRKKE